MLMWPHDFWKDTDVMSSWLKARLEQTRQSICRLVRNAGQEMKFEGISLYFSSCSHGDFCLHLKKKSQCFTTASINNTLLFSIRMCTFVISIQDHILKSPFKDFFFFPRNLDEHSF